MPDYGQLMTNIFMTIIVITVGAWSAGSIVFLWLGIRRMIKDHLE